MFTFCSIFILSKNEIVRYIFEFDFSSRSLPPPLPLQPPVFSRLHRRKVSRAPWWVTHPKGPLCTTSWVTPCSTRRSPSHGSSKIPSNRSWRNMTHDRSSTSCVLTWYVQYQEKSYNCASHEGSWIELWQHCKNSCFARYTYRWHFLISN